MCVLHDTANFQLSVVDDVYLLDLTQPIAPLYEGTAPIETIGFVRRTTSREDATKGNITVGANIIPVEKITGRVVETGAGMEPARQRGRLTSTSRRWENVGAV